MARSAFVNPVTGAPRRANKRSRSKNCRWMHLGAQEVGTRKIIQKVLARYSVSAMNSMFLSSYALILRSAFIGPIPIAMQQAIDYLLARANFYMHAVTRYTLIDNYLYDIPLTEWLYTREHRTRQHLCLGNLPDDRTAMKMTSFTIAQLQRLYHHFGLRQFVHGQGETELRIGTNTFRAGGENCYLIHPEELFLFSLTRIKTGMTQEVIVDMYFGGDYNRWSYGHRWLMFYLDHRYFSIIGHEGILRFLPQFREFRDAIERYCQKDRLYVDHQNNEVWVPGLVELPYNICGFIDGTCDRILVPFSGPAGDFDGAPRREQYILGQESMYSGNKKCHAHTCETLLFPNGMSTVFGPVSGRMNDRGVLNLSGLDTFLVLIQAHLPPQDRCMVFGDAIYRGNALQMITSYYHAIPPNVLSFHERVCNAAFRAARMPIEKNYGQQTCVQRICDTRWASRYGAALPYAIEQWRVCHLLLNCYICFNGDQASGTGTFAMPPPNIDWYLRL